MSWQDLCDDGLPDHSAAMLARGPWNQPSIAEQSATHGASLPPVDNGPDPGSVTG
jgi:hypothetical protein